MSRADIHLSYNQSVPFVPMPDGGGVIYQWFKRIGSSRRYIDGVPEQITSLEIDSWARLNAIRLTPRHVQAIEAMDAAFCSEMPEAIRYARKRTNPEK